MAKRGQRVSTRKRTAAKRHKGTTRRMTARGKTTKRGVRKTTAKKLVKRAAREKAVAPNQPQKPVAAITEDTIVDIIEHPAPGVTVVTELETVRTRQPKEDDESSD